MIVCELRSYRGMGIVMVLVSVRQHAMRAQICHFLNGKGLRTKQVQGVSALLDAFEQHACAIELLVAEYPSHAAMSVIPKLLDRCPTLKVLLISGDPEEIGQEAFPHPRLEFVEKPFSWRELGERIDGLLTQPGGARCQGPSGGTRPRRSVA